MSAPVTDRPRGGTRTATIPAQRGRPLRDRTETTAVRSGAVRTERRTERRTAAARAYERRDDRLRRLVGAQLERVTAVPGRTPFVLLVMGLLAVGLIATLWLSTAAAADSYRLTDARAAARSLQEQSELLHREVATMESAPAVARRAEELGMVHVQDPPRLVVAPNGAVALVGEPSAVTRPAPVVAPAAPAAPAQLPAEAATQADGTPPAAGTPVAGEQAGTSTGGQQSAHSGQQSVQPAGTG